MTALAAALDYAARGFAVFPCWPKTKEPSCRRGFKEATTNPATIRRWWLARSDFNIAIATGVQSRVWIFDIDGSVGAAALAELEAHHGWLPPTLCSVTSAGCHIWFRCDRPIPSTVGHIAIGLDVRGDGGYAMAPPSVHPDGPIYRWSNALPPAVAPDWLIDLARKKPEPVSIPQSHVERRYTGPSYVYGKAALDREIRALANTLPGARNHALNRASFSLHQLVAGGELDAAEVRDRLIRAATANGLMTDPADGPRSVERTIASGARAGLMNPRMRRGAS
jgi:hypothetical protein